MKPAKWMHLSLLAIFLTDTVLILINRENHFLSRGSLSIWYFITWNVISLVFASVLLYFAFKRRPLRDMAVLLLYPAWQCLLLSMAKSGSTKYISEVDIFFLLLSAIYCVLMLADKIGWHMTPDLRALSAFVALYTLVDMFLSTELYSRQTWRVTQLELILLILGLFMFLCLIWFSVRLRKKEWLELEPSIALRDYLEQRKLRLSVNIAYWLYVTFFILLVGYLGLSVHRFGLSMLIGILIMLMLLYIVTQLLIRKRVYAALYLISPLFILPVILLPLISFYWSLQAVMRPYSYPISIIWFYMLTAILALGLGYWFAWMSSKVTSKRGIVVMGVYLCLPAAVLYGYLMILWVLMALQQREYMVSASILNIPLLSLILLVCLATPVAKFAGWTKWLFLYLITIVVFLLIAVWSAISMMPIYQISQYLHETENYVQQDYEQIARLNSPGSLTDCDNFTDSQRYTCIENYAVHSSNASACDLIDEVHFRTGCLNKIAISHNDYTYCLNLAEGNQVEYGVHNCITIIAERNNDLTLCDNINYSPNRENCIDRVMEYNANQQYTQQNCDNIELPVKKAQCYRDSSSFNCSLLDIGLRDICLHGLKDGLQVQNLEFCDKLVLESDIGMCQEYIAIYQNDSNICKLIKDSNIRTSCFTQFALNNNDTTYCSGLDRGMDVEYEMDRCISAFAIQVIDLAICDKIAYENNRDNCRMEVLLKLAAIEQDPHKCDLMEMPFKVATCYGRYRNPDGSKPCNLLSPGLSDICMYGPDGMQKQNLDFCNTLVSEYDIGMCEYNIAVYRNESTMCGIINNGALADTCYTELAVINKDMELCNKCGHTQNRQYCIAAVKKVLK